jgi:hypothetical protein
VYDDGFWLGTRQRQAQGVIEAIAPQRRPTLRAEREQAFVEFLLRSKR